MASFRLKYQGEVLRDNLNHEELADLLQDLALEFYENENFDPEQLEMEEIN